MSVIQQEHIIIIGGTSGIGLALANSYLKQGWQVSIVGSNLKKIEQLQQTLKIKYPTLAIYPCDISQIEQLESLLKILSEKAFNVLVYSAGWYLNERKQTLNKADSEKMLAINLQVFNHVFCWAGEHLKNDSTINTAVNKHLVCLASIAGRLDYQQSSLYAKCKHAMIVTSQAYRSAFKPFDIKVTCIASGYVETEQLKNLNDGDASHKPFIISEQEAVTEIQYAISNNVAVHCFPKKMKIIVSLLGQLPKPLLNKLMTWQYKKQDNK